MEKVTINTGITKVYGQITVDEVKQHAFKADRFQAQLRQVVETKYPSARANNSKSDSLFDVAAFNFGEGKNFEEKRVTWIDVPLNTTEDTVAEMLKNFPKARLQKHLSSKPILTDEQQHAVDNGIKRADGVFVEGSEIFASIEQGQRVRNNEEELIDREGGLIEEDDDFNVAAEDQARIQYKEIYFRTSEVEDIDTRERLNQERINVTAMSTTDAMLQAAQAANAVTPTV